jgi:hypothetical protein
MPGIIWWILDGFRAVGTVGACIIALYATLHRKKPKLSICKYSDFGMYAKHPDGTPEGGEFIYYHLMVKNSNGIIAPNVTVNLVKFELKHDGTFTEHSTIPLPYIWTPRLDYKKPPIRDDITRLISSTAVFDFGRINKKTGVFQALAIKVASSDIDIHGEGTAKYYLEIVG